MGLSRHKTIRYNVDYTASGQAARINQPGKRASGYPGRDYHQYFITLKY